MNNLIKMRDTGDNNRLYAFLTHELADDFCDCFDRPFDLVGVDVR